MKWGGTEWNTNFIPLFGYQWWNEIKLSLYRLGNEQNEINYNIFILILPLFKNMEVEEIIKCNKKNAK
jgi:hypothetical protein